MCTLGESDLFSKVRKEEGSLGPPGLGSWTEPRELRELLDPWSRARAGSGQSPANWDNWAGLSPRGWHPRIPKM